MADLEGAEPPHSLSDKLLQTNLNKLHIRYPKMAEGFCSPPLFLEFLCYAYFVVLGQFVEMSQICDNVCVIVSSLCRKLHSDSVPRSVTAFPNHTAAKLGCSEIKKEIGKEEKMPFFCLFH